mmetsp:Transcript_39205/g.112749  ORF Transcript_39205/g.112749 Transcript_39205/m.112749 type:complete len:202 (-) Transcript_39205:465-1070(-)
MRRRPARDTRGRRREQTRSRGGSSRGRASGSPACPSSCRGRRDLYIPARRDLCARNAAASPSSAPRTGGGSATGWSPHQPPLQFRKGPPAPSDASTPGNHGDLRRNTSRSHAREEVSRARRCPRATPSAMRPTSRPLRTPLANPAHRRSTRRRGRRSCSAHGGTGATSWSAVCAAPAHMPGARPSGRPPRVTPAPSRTPHC